MKQKSSAAASAQTLCDTWALLALIVLCLVVYGRCVTFEHTLYDDPQIIFENPHVMSGLTVESVRWALMNPNFGLYMPLPTLTFMLDRNLFGDWAGGYHGMTLLWHILCVCTFFVVMRRLTGNFAAVFTAALLVAIHPVQAMTVNWISARNEIMPTFFMLLSIEMYRQWRTGNAAAAGRLQSVRGAFGDALRPAPLLSLLFMFFGLMSKQGIVALPAVLLLLDYWPLGRIELLPRQPWRTLRRGMVLIAEKLPWFALSGVGVFFAFYGKLDFGAFEGEHLTSPIENIGFACTTYARYLGHLIYPERYIMAYSAAGPGPAWWFIVFSALLMATITALVTLHLWKRPWLMVWWGWFVLFLLPVSGLVRYAAESIALRYLYAPGMGLYLLFGFGFYALACRNQDCDAFNTPKTPPRWFWVMVAVLTLASAALCYRQSGFWRNSETLARRALAVTQGMNAMAHNHLGVLHDRAGRQGLAFAHFRAALDHEPERNTWKTNYAIALNRQQRFAETLDIIAPILEEQPDRPLLLNLYGGALLGLGRLEAALPHLERAVEIEPDYVPSRFNLAWCLYQLERHGEARTHVEHALKVQPTHRGAQTLLAAIKDATENE